MKQNFAAFFVGAIIIIVASCSKTDPCSVASAQTDPQKIQAYLAAKGLMASLITPDSVYYIINTPGTGTSPNASSTVTVNYKGYLLDGTVFDQNSNISFPLSGVIRGWTIGFPKFKRGGKGTLLIPSADGYGAISQDKIPCNSVLIFDIELINF